MSALCGRGKTLPCEMSRKRRLSAVRRARPVTAVSRTGLSRCALWGCLALSPCALGLIPSTNTRPSRSASVRTMPKPFASRVLFASPLEAREGGTGAREQTADAGRRCRADEHNASARPEDAGHLAHARVRARRKASRRTDRPCRRRRRDRMRRLRAAVATASATSTSTSTPAFCGAACAHVPPTTRQARWPPRARQTHFRGDGGKPRAVCAADECHAVAQFHAGHADDEHVRIAPARERVQHIGTVYVDGARTRLLGGWGSGLGDWGLATGD